MQLETPGQTKAPVSPPANPVYSEITDVSAVDPVYTDIINKRKPRPQDYVNVPFQGDTAAYDSSLPMVSQHVTMRRADSVDDKDGVDLARNEAYGLIQNVICQGGIYCCL